MPQPTAAACARRLLILGASGQCGRAAARAFLGGGWQVLAQCRRADALLEPGVQPISLPLHDTAALTRAAAGARWVLYAVSLPYPRWAREALPLLQHALTLAETLGARLVLPGNLYGFGSPLPALLDESLPQRPTTRKARLRVAMEAALERAACPSLVLRAGDFFGGSGPSWFAQLMVKGLPRGRLVSPGALDRPHPWAYLPDLAQALVRLAEREALLPRHARLHFAGHACSAGELLQAAAQAGQALGWPAPAWPPRPLPWWALRLSAPLWPLARELLELRPQWQQGHALDGRRLAALIGPEPHTPLPQALQHTLLALHGAAPQRGAARD